MSRPLRSYGLISPPHRRATSALAGLLFLSGCGSISVLGKDANSGPEVTSSLAAVEVREPLPQKLAYSDATKIGQAAAVALREVDSDTSAAAESTDWVNAATGSSGTLEEVKKEGSDDVPGDCGMFKTIVTSFTGVHRYSGKVCQGDGGRPVVELSDQETTSGS